MGDDVPGSGVTGCGMTGVATISGDFDVRIRTEMTDTVANDQRSLCMFDVTTSCTDTSGGTPASTDGVHLRNLVGTIVQVWSVVNSVFTQRGTNTNPLCGDGQFWHRVARTGTSWTTYFSCNGSTWTTDETFTFSTTNALYPIFEFFRNGPAEAGGTTDFDSWQMTTGTPDSGGFRASGDWISTSFTVPAAQRVSQIELTHSSLSATAYIDQLDIRDSGGAVLESFTTDITSGTSTVLTPSGNRNGILTVRVFLAGNGAGTPVLEAVAITYGALPSTAEGGVPVSPVSVRCGSRWPSMEVLCIGSVNQDWRSAVGGISRFSWYVDGRLVKSGHFVWSSDGKSDLLVEPDSFSVSVSGAVYQPTNRNYKIVLFVASMIGINAISPEVGATFSSEWLWVLYFAIFAIAGLALLSRVKTRRPPSKPPLGLIPLIAAFVLFVFFLSGDTRIFWLPAFGILGLTLWAAQSHLVKKNHGREE